MILSVSFRPWSSAICFYICSKFEDIPHILPIQFHYSHACPCHVPPYNLQPPSVSHTEHTKLSFSNRIPKRNSNIDYTTMFEIIQAPVCEDTSSSFYSIAQLSGVHGPAPKTYICSGQPFSTTSSFPLLLPLQTPHVPA